MTSIKQEFLDEILHGPKKMIIKGRLMAALNRSDEMVKNYLETNSPNLTRKDALTVICEELGKTEEEILTA